MPEPDLPEMFGPYRLEELIGRGGMGEVHRAYDTVRERAVALKRLPAALAGDPTFRARFRSEAALAARLHEPHVVPIHDYGEIDGRLYIDMRLVEGADLAALLHRDGPLAPERAVDVVAQVAAALDAAHAAGLVHRDIKPGNILLSRPAASDPHADPVAATRAADFVYVADFGIARATDTGNSGSLTSTGTTVGSLDYIAPERFNTGHGDHRVDIYALGCVLHEALTAQRPFPVEGLPAIINAHLNTPPPAPTALRPDLPAALDAVVARAMAKDPDERYPSAGALAGAARDALTATEAPDAAVTSGAGLPSGGPSPADPGVTAHVYSGPLPAPEGGRRGVRRRRLTLLAVLATVLVLGAAALATQLLRSGDDPDTVVTEPAGGPGANPYMPPVTTSPPGTVPPVTNNGNVPGDTPGLYGGTLNNASCDPAQMITFLQQHPDKARAWADVEGIGTGDIPAYINGLTPVVLRSDTAVTNHGFAGGGPTTLHSVLQAGTAVLVDRNGVPRARCYCGNPLTPAAGPAAPHYTGARWTGFAPGNVVTVTPAAAPLSGLTLVDPVSLTVFTRPIGSTGGEDQLANPTTPTEAPPPPPPPPHPPQPRSRPTPRQGSRHRRSSSARRLRRHRNSTRRPPHRSS